MDEANSILVGAARWLHELSFRDEDGARLSLRSQAGFKDLTPTQYEIALDWLRARDMYPVREVSADWTRSAAARVLGAAIAATTPPWLPDADSLIRSPSELPIDIVELGEQLGLNHQEAFDEVKRVWRKFDDTAQRALGAAGEAALVHWLEENVDAKVVQVSLFDDTAGYDLALMIGERTHARIEVKTTRREDSVIVFLSRNELDTMRANTGWCLQVVHLNPDDSIRFLSWITPETIHAGEPRDGRLATWQSMKMTLPTHALRPGPAPPVEALLSLCVVGPDVDAVSGSIADHVDGPILEVCRELERVPVMLADRSGASRRVRFHRRTTITPKRRRRQTRLGPFPSEAEAPTSRSVPRNVRASTIRRRFAHPDQRRMARLATR